MIKTPQVYADLCGYEFSSKVIKVLKLDLRYSVITRLVESEIILVMEDIWDQMKEGNSYQV